MAAVLVVGAALVAGDLVVVEAAVVVSGLNFISICRKEFPLSYDTDYDYLGRSLHTAAVWSWSRGSLNTDTRIVFEVSPIKFCLRRNCYETFQRNNHTRLDSEFGDLCCTYHVLPGAGGRGLVEGGWGGDQGHTIQAEEAPSL